MCLKKQKQYKPKWLVSIEEKKNYTILPFACKGEKYLCSFYFHMIIRNIIQFQYSEMCDFILIAFLFWFGLTLSQSYRIHLGFFCSSHLSCFWFGCCYSFLQLFGRTDAHSPIATAAAKKEKNSAGKQNLIKTYNQFRLINTKRFV